MSLENSNPSSVSKAVLEAVPKLVEVLSPLSLEDRQRAISATMVLFGHSVPIATIHSPKAAAHVEQIPSEDGVSAKASLWMKKYGITRQQLDHVFSIEADSIDVIAA